MPRLCRNAARPIPESCSNRAVLTVPPETITIELGHRRFRYIRPFTVRPAAPLGAGILDFGASATGAMILHGYRDAAVQIREFLAYAPRSHFGAARHVLRMAPA